MKVVRQADGLRQHNDVPGCHEERDGMRARKVAWRPNGRNTPIWRRAGVLLGDSPVLIVGLLVVSVLAGLCEAVILGLLASIAVALVGDHSTVNFLVGPLHVETGLRELLVVGFATALARGRSPGVPFLPPCARSARRYKPIYVFDYLPPLAGHRGRCSRPMERANFRSSPPARFSKRHRAYSRL